MNVLLTGSLGLLSRQVVKQLSPRARQCRGIPIRTMRDRNLTPATMGRELAAYDAVIYFFPKSAQYNSSGKHYYHAQVEDLQFVVEACKLADVQRFVLVSTANTVGPGSYHCPATEWNEFAFFRVGSAAINSNFLSERWVLEQSVYGFPAIVVNPTKIIGDTDYWPFSVPATLKGAGGKIPWVPRGGANFVSAQAAAKGVIGALEQGRVGERYLLTGENSDYLKLFSLLDKTFGRRPALRKRLPPKLLRVLGQIGRLDQRRASVFCALDKTSSYLLSLERYYSGQKAVLELDMPYTPLEEALQELLSISDLTFSTTCDL